jgi:hypothetical protein
VAWRLSLGPFHPLVFIGSFWRGVARSGEEWRGVARSPSSRLPRHRDVGPLRLGQRTKPRAIHQANLLTRAMRRKQARISICPDFESHCGDRSNTRVAAVVLAALAFFQRLLQPPSRPPSRLPPTTSLSHTHSLLLSSTPLSLSLPLYLSFLAFPLGSFPERTFPRGR